MSDNTQSTSRLAVALRHVTGGSDWRVIIYVVSALILLGWCADGIRDVLLAIVPADWGVVAAGVLALPFFLLILPGYWWVRRTARALRYRVESQAPDPVEALIIYLSAVDSRDPDVAQIQRLTDAALHRHRWRMPVAAIKHHCAALREVVVIASPGEQGSLNQWSQFRDLLARLWPDHSWRLRLAGELAPDLAEGVDFYKLPALVEATDTVVRRLVAEGIDGSRVLIDITGGTQLTGIAGAAVALEQGRRFQYISISAGQDDIPRVQVFASTYRME